MHIIPLVVVTAFFVLGMIGTVAKLLFDGWRVRQAARLPVLPLPVKPESPVGK